MASIRLIESQIKTAEWRLDFYSELERKYRTEVKLPRKHLYPLIRKAKKQRKQAQSDLDYWWSELEKV